MTQTYFKGIKVSHMIGCHAAIVVYDITDLDSFAAVDTWIADLREQLLDSIHIYLVGNKADMDTHRKVSTEMGKVSFLCLTYPEQGPGTFTLLL